MVLKLLLLSGYCSCISLWYCNCATVEFMRIDEWSFKKRIIPFSFFCKKYDFIFWNEWGGGGGGGSLSSKEKRECCWRTLLETMRIYRAALYSLIDISDMRCALFRGDILGPPIIWIFDRRSAPLARLDGCLVIWRILCAK